MYIVIELQKIGNQITNIVNAYENKNEADSKFYSVLAAAAVSTVEKHAASLLDEDGRCLMSGVYTHESEDE